MNRAPILHTFGILLLLFCSVYVAPLLLALTENGDTLRAFAWSLGITAASGAVLSWHYRGHWEGLSWHGAFLVVALFWCGLSAYGALPFLLLSGLELSFTDALFESLSGLTTTGATILSGLDALPRSLLLFRQSLQWLGGIGLVVIAVSVLPLLGIGGLQLYRAEMPGAVKDNRPKPRILATARLLFLVYCGLTAACALAYWLAGMSLFDAICHSFSTIAIGGFSTHDESFGFFAEQPLILWIAVVFMVLAGINFALHFYALGKSPRTAVRNYWSDPECRSYLAGLAIISLVLVAALWLYRVHPLPDSLLHGVFQAVSIATTTGFQSTGFAFWPAFLPYFLVGTAFVGACAGSTGGGIKVVRMLLILKQGLRELHYLVHPRSVLPLKLGRRPVPEQSVRSVWSFFAMYLAAFCVLLIRNVGDLVIA